MKKIYIPENLQLSELVPPDYQNTKDLDRLHYLIHLIYEQRIMYKNPSEYVPLKAIYIRNLIGRASKTYNEYINLLINKSVIKCDKHFVINEKSYGYKLCEPYSLVKHKQISITSTCLIKNIERWQAKRLPTTKVHLYLYGFLKKLDINYDAASHKLEELSVTEYNNIKISIDKLKNKDFFLYNDSFGKRIHTNITNLKSTMRKHLLYHNQKLVNVDVVNCQPLLILISIPSLLSSIRCTEDIYFEEVASDVLMYKRLVEQGKLYEFLMNRAGELDRGKFKENFFQEVFFGKKTSNFFCDLFPTIGREIKKVKKKDYKRLAKLMQRAESKLIISKICYRIMEEYPGVFISTIHDSILTTEENVSKIKKVMIEEFNKLGLSPTVRIETA